MLQDLSEKCHVAIQIDSKVMRVPPKMKGVAQQRSGCHRAPNAVEAKAFERPPALLERAQKPACRKVDHAVDAVRREGVIAGEIEVGIEQLGGAPKLVDS